MATDRSKIKDYIRLKVGMRMVGSDVVAAAAHAADPEPDSGSHLDPIGDHGENTSSGSNEDITGLNGDRSPLPPHSTNYDSGDGHVVVHRCDKCETYETVSRSALLAHMARCSPGVTENGDGDMDGRRGDRKLFECDVCNMKFSNGANMRRHKMRHTGVKPYECRVCQKRFFRKDHLAEHFTTHTKTLPYHCPICNRGFQRQIAMRAHFQNEHVGQHDMIKSCPLCSYRAGTMKSLRVHFFNRHGIDLDNPGQNPIGVTRLDASNLNVFSDSGDSQGARSADNSTPPMHFLTPHVEISMTDASGYSPKRQILVEPTPSDATNGDVSSSPHSRDSNIPTSSHLGDGERITPPSAPPSPPPSLPVLSVFPLVKQESADEDIDDIYDEKKNGMVPVNLSMNGKKASSPSPINHQASLIKVSPLKSLLRDDLKKKLNSRAGLKLNGARSPPTPPLTGDEAPSPRKDAPLLPSSVLNLQNLQCVFCGIWFPDQTLYFLHKGCHCDNNPWKCNICGEQSSNVYQFNSHLLSNSHQ